MTVATLTLTEFLMARIAEDEARSEWQHRLLCLRTACDRDGCLWDDEEVMARERVCTCGYPARVLAECEAKRRIVDYWADSDNTSGGSPIDADVTLMSLAAVYADHPDYRDEWRP